MATSYSSTTIASHTISPAWNQTGSTYSNTHGRYSSTNEIHVNRNTTTRRLQRPRPLRMASAPSGYVSRHGKLHKRSESGSSLISTASTMSFAHKPDASSRATSATQLIKPYLRKMSMKDSDEEQGRLDLSRPSGDHEEHEETVSSLGIRDFSTGSHSVSDVNFLPAARRRSHKRATSLSSPLSPHVQSVRSPSNPYSPSSVFSATFPRSEDEVDESADILADDLHRNSIERWRTRRATSVGSAPFGITMHQSQTHSSASLTKFANASQSNLSTRSTSSNGTAAEPMIGRSRVNTTKSFDLGATASSRTSVDRAVSFLSRTSEPEDPAARAANIRALRRAFEEKEAAKERKLEKVEMKRRDTMESRRQKQDDKQRRKSEVSDESHRRKSTNTGASTHSVFDMNEKPVAGTEYSRHTPVHSLSLPIQGGHGGAATETTRANTDVSKTKAAKGVWVRFRAWSKTRMLSCY